MYYTDEQTTSIAHADNDTDSSSEDEEIARIFQPQKGQHSKKDTPQCVNMLERLEREKGYTGRYMKAVSNWSVLMQQTNKQTKSPKNKNKPQLKNREIHQTPFKLKWNHDYQLWAEAVID